MICRAMLRSLTKNVQQLASHPDTLAAAKDKLQLVAPVFDINGTRIVTASSHASSSGTSASWADLEAQALNNWDRKGKKPMRLLPPRDQVLASVGGEFYSHQKPPEMLTARQKALSWKCLPRTRSTRH